MELNWKNISAGYGCHLGYRGHLFGSKSDKYQCDNSHIYMVKEWSMKGQAKLIDGVASWVARHE